MPQLVTFPDVEDLLRLWVPTVLADVAGYGGTTPATFPALSVTAVRTGGGSRDLVVDLPTLSLDCRATKEHLAFRLARDLRAHLHAAEREGFLLDVPLYEVVEASGPYLNPDPLNPAQHRYSITVQLAVRGVVS